MLNIIETTHEKISVSSNRKGAFAAKLQQEAKLEKLWKDFPDSFDGTKEVRGRERLYKTFWQIKKILKKKPARICDLGVGSGYFVPYLLAKGHFVDVVDISNNALKNIQTHSNLKKYQSVLPKTVLSDAAYDLVLALDVATDIFPEQHRLFMSEVGRLLKRGGFAIFSTPLDYTTKDPLHAWLALLQTEFQVVELSPSWHALFDRLSDYVSLGSRSLRIMERLCRFFSHDTGMSSVITVVQLKQIGV